MSDVPSSFSAFFCQLLQGDFY